MEVIVTQEILGEEPDADLEWLAEDGDTVEAGQPIATLETAKVTLELLAPAAGTLQVLIAGPALVEVGTKIGIIT